MVAVVVAAQRLAVAVGLMWVSVRAVHVDRAAEVVVVIVVVVVVVARRRADVHDPRRGRRRQRLQSPLLLLRRRLLLLLLLPLRWVPPAVVGRRPRQVGVDGHAVVVVVVVVVGVGKVMVVVVAVEVVFVVGAAVERLAVCRAVGKVVRDKRRRRRFVAGAVAAAIWSTLAAAV